MCRENIKFKQYKEFRKCRNDTKISFAKIIFELRIRTRNKVNFRCQFITPQITRKSSVFKIVSKLLL